MADRPRFGPAGIPHLFKEAKAPISELPYFLRKQGLDALEYSGVRWGQKPHVTQEEAEKMGRNAEKHDVWLTIHGSYYVNLLGNKDILKASKNRLIACATCAQWMRAHTIVFHPGFYSNKQSRRKDMQNCVRTLKELQETMHSMNLKANLGLENAGKLTQLGCLEEIIAICENVEQTQPVIDWAHLHARQRGILRTSIDFQEIVEKVERRLGSKVAKNLHCHFSHVEYTFRGERRHHNLSTPGHGPKFELLAEVIVKLGLKPVVISESPLSFEDAKRMRDQTNHKLELTRSCKKIGT